MGLDVGEVVKTLDTTDTLLAVPDGHCCATCELWATALALIAVALAVACAWEVPGGRTTLL